MTDVDELERLKARVANLETMVEAINEYLLPDDDGTDSLEQEHQEFAAHVKAVRNI